MEPMAIARRSQTSRAAIVARVHRIILRGVEREYLFYYNG